MKTYLAIVILFLIGCAEPTDNRLSLYDYLDVLEAERSTECLVPVSPQDIGVVTSFAMPFAIASYTPGRNSHTTWVRPAHVFDGQRGEAAYDIAELQAATDANTSDGVTDVEAALRETRATWIPCLETRTTEGK